MRRERERWTLLLAAALAGCLSGPESPDLGAAEVAITQVPASVLCLRITVTGTRSSVRSIDVAAGGSTAALTLGGLSLGATTFSGEAFSVACSAVTSSSVATWVAAPVVVTVAAGVTASVSLVMKRNGQADVSVDFQDDGPPPGTITEFDLPPQSVYPNAITAGPDGNVWFTEQGKIGRITPAGAVTTFDLATSTTEARGITAAPDGNVWFCEHLFTSKVGRITPSGVITELDIPGGITCNAITQRAEDGLLWFTSTQHSYIGTLTTGGAFNVISLGFPSGDSGILAAFGKVWVLDTNHSNLESFTTLAATSEAVYSLYPDVPVGELAAGPDGNIYITAADKIVVFSPSTNTVVGRVPIATAGGYARGITAGSDGNLWFTESNADRLGRLTTGGSLTEYPLPTTNSGPWLITNGPDGNLWFTEHFGFRIGNMVPL
jgi:streptogramin lyase